MSPTLVILTLIVLIVALEWDWFKMAGSFVVKELGEERRALNFLKAKLAVLHWLVREIQKTEAELAKQKSGGRGVSGQVESD